MSGVKVLVVRNTGPSISEQMRVFVDDKPVQFLRGVTLEMDDWGSQVVNLKLSCESFEVIDREEEFTTK